MAVHSSSRSRQTWRVRAIFAGLMAIALLFVAAPVPAHAATVSVLTLKIATDDGTAAPGIFVAVGDTVKRTKADGTVKFKRVKSGKQRIVLSLTKGLVTTGWQHAKRITVPAQKKASVTVRTSSITVVTGKVTKKLKANKKTTAVKNRPVSVFQAESTFTGKTDKTGTYAITIPKPIRAAAKATAQVAVDFRAGGLVYAPSNTRATEGKKYRLNWGRATRVNVRVTTKPAGGAISGVVRDASGKRLVGAVVSVETVSPAGVLVRTMTTGAKGKFAIGGLPKSTYRIYAADADERRDLVKQATAQTVTVKKAQVKIGAIRLPQTGDIVVPIVASASFDRSVTVHLLDEDGLTGETDWVFSNEWPTPTNAKFRNVPVGRYRIALGGMNTASAYFDVTAGAMTTVPALTTPAMATISGKVSLSDGTGFRTFITAIDSFGTVSDGDYASAKGTFTIDDVGPGDYQLNAATRQEVTTGAKKVIVAKTGLVKVTVVPGTPLSGVQVPIALGAKASGKVIDAKTNKPVANVKVVAQRVTPTGSPEDDVFITETNSKGAYSIPGLAPNTDFRIAFVDADGVYRTLWHADTKKGTVKKEAKATTVNFTAAEFSKLGTVKLK